MDGIWVIGLIVLMVLLPRILNVIFLKGANSVQRKMDERAQRKEDEDS